MLMNGKYTALPLSIVDFWQKICEEGLLIEECCQVLFRVINQANYIAQKKRPSFIAYIVLDPLQVKCLLLNHDIKLWVMTFSKILHRKFIQKYVQKSCYLTRVGLYFQKVPNFIIKGLGCGDFWHFMNI